jgi:hypothetical protein
MIVVALGVCFAAELQEAVVGNQGQPAQAYTPNEQSNGPTANLGAPQDGSEGDRKGHWYDHLTDWLLVLFNGILAIFTVRLFYNAAEQSRDTKASIAIAKRAADSAELSAQAAIGLQLPRLVVHGMSMYAAGQPYGNWEPFTQQVGGGPPPDTFQIEMQIDNVGKTHAYLTEHCMMQYIGPRLPKIPEYKEVVSAPVGEIIRAEDGYVVIHVRNQFFHINAGQRHAMENIELSHHLWIYGLVRFADFMGKVHEQRFCKRWTRFGPFDPPGGFVSEGDTPEEYAKSY